MNRYICYAGVLVLGLAGALFVAPARAADPVAVPPIEHLERLTRGTQGRAAADAPQKVLQVVCIGDSHTDGPA